MTPEKETPTPEDQKRVEEWKKIAREKLAPNVTYIDKKFAEVASWAQELLNAFWAEQQKDLDDFLTTTVQRVISEAEVREKTLRDIHKVELDTISCMSLEQFVLWKDQRQNIEKKAGLSTLNK